jgi:cobalamin biosynthesis protein CobT
MRTRGGNRWLLLATRPVLCVKKKQKTNQKEKKVEKVVDFSGNARGRMKRVSG